MAGERRGWRETIEPGIYRAHRVACPASADQQAGRRCGCPLQIKVPGRSPGTTRMVTIDGTLTQARSERRRMMAEGRPTTLEVGQPITVHALATEWLMAGRSRWTQGTFELREHSYRTRIAGQWGSLELGALTRPAIEAWAAKLIAQDHGRRAVEIAVQTLRAMLAVALERDLIQANPAARIRLPPAPPSERTAADRVIDTQGIERLCAACRDVRQETMIRAMAEAGLRRGEIAGLTWPDVLLDERRLVIRQAIWQSKRAGKIVKRPKGEKPGRVAITAALADGLRRWRDQSIGAGKGDPSGWVWPGRSGEPMSPSSVSHLAGRIGRAAGLVDGKGRHIANAHGLRHSAGSIALSEGAPLTVVSSQLRHSRPSFTAARYSHLLGDAELDRFAAAHAAGTVRETVRGKKRKAKKPNNKAV